MRSADEDPFKLLSKTLKEKGLEPAIKLYENSDISTIYHPELKQWETKAKERRAVEQYVQLMDILLKYHKALPPRVQYGTNLLPPRPTPFNRTISN